MSEFSAPGVYVLEESPTVRSISGVTTSVVLVVGVTERGPVRAPTLVTSFSEYTQIFGNDIVNGDVSHAMRAFFTYGGQQAYVSRIVHYTNPSSTATKQSAAGSVSLSTPATSPSGATLLGSVVGPFIFANGDNLVINTDGGGLETATFNAEAASLTSVDGPFILSDGNTLTVSVDGEAAQTISFLSGEFSDISAATPAEVAAVLNSKLVGVSAGVVGSAVVITTDSRGTSASVQVTGGTANSQLSYNTVATAGSGNVADIRAVTPAEIKAVVEAATTGLVVTNLSGRILLSSSTTGVGSSILVDSSSTADNEIGFSNATAIGGNGAAVPTLSVVGKYDGAYSDNIRVTVAQATNLEIDHFNLQVEDKGVIVSTYINLNVVPGSANYAVKVVGEGSNLISIVDLGNGGIPASGTSPFLSGGDDGIAALNDADVVGSQAGKTGLFAFDTVTGANLLIAPGQTSASVHNAMINYAENVRNKSLFAVLDPPPGLTKVQMKDYVTVTAGLKNSSEFGAIYWPQVKVLNPNRAVYGDVATITIPPCGQVVGCMARNDKNILGGVYQSPAGVERGALPDVLGFETDENLEETTIGFLYPECINVLTTERGQPRYIDGGRTLKRDGNFPNVAERRGVIYIEQSIKAGLLFAKHLNNNARLRNTVQRTVDGFLLAQMNVGAFRSNVPNLAFQSDFSDALNPASSVFAGKLQGRVGLATNKPAEFIILTFSQDTRALETETSV